ncbi:hypothetical protein [Acetivibrio straminisolvens]|jgi:hypothetical protein|uniref:Uncharacterized protein n=1 Tax=Acetivibrio straminisolvens JCM 21531 TaxID=1294263 RepID=W4V3S3_9FIRM|nr:hypothetical protein [Acetivibrio straminisolvens]GAE87453.1 hypothetical protein JCM21531_823 [Acetivibrio straminisolvens JCM 21531]
MEDRFLVYLFYCFAIVLILMLVFILMAIKRKNKRKKAINTKSIDYGNVCVFFDEDNNVTVIPYARDKHGIGIAVEGPMFLKAPYKPLELGGLVRSSMATCNGKIIHSDNQLMNKLKCKSWNEFSEGKRNISIYYKEELGLVLNTTKKGSDGSYSFNFRGYEKVLKNDVSDEELGIVIMNLLERCR